MRVNREKLLAALELVSPGLSPREVLQQSSCFIFKDKKVVTFNDETACSYRSPLDESFVGAVQSDPLKALLSKFKEEELDITQTKSELLVKGKGQNAGITMEKEITLPLDALEPPKKWKNLSEKFSDAVKFVQSCAGRDAAKFELTCIHAHPEYVEAYDNYQFARYYIKTPLIRDCLIRQSALSNIISLTMIEFCETDSWIHFRNAQKLVLSCRRHLEEYRNLDKIAAATGQKIVLPKGLADISDRAEVFSIENTENKENSIRIDLKPGSVTVRGEGVFGWYEGFRKIKYSGEPLSFMIQPKMMVELIKQHSECQVSEHALIADVGDGKFITSLEIPIAKPSKKGKK